MLHLSAIQLVRRKSGVRGFCKNKNSDKYYFQQNISFIVATLECHVAIPFTKDEKPGNEKETIIEPQNGFGKAI